VTRNTSMKQEFILGVEFNSTLDRWELRFSRQWLWRYCLLRCDVWYLGS
jgi:hypothetical protein